MRIANSIKALLVSACILTGAAAWAQQKTAPPAKLSADVAFTFAAERSQVVPERCCFWFKGGGVDASLNFAKGWGLAAAFNGDHAKDISPNVDANKISILFGPRYTWTTYTAKQHRVQVYGQGLFGWARGFEGLYPAGRGVSSSDNSLGIQAGGGINYFLTPKVGIRLVEADWVRTGFANGADNVQNDLRLSAGLVFHFDGAQPAPVTLACSASPSTVFPGDPVTVTATAGNLTPKMNVVYSFSGQGVTGSGATANVATAALAPGSYTVNCGVKEGKAGKEGLKPWETASASASFTVKQFEPPTIGCSASPATIKPGETSSITANGVSPQNRPLTYSYSAPAGTVSGANSTATFNSANAPVGPVAVTCSVSDDKGQTATAATTVTIVAPPPPQPSPEQIRLEAHLALHSVFFPTAQPAWSTASRLPSPHSPLTSRAISASSPMRT